MKSCFFSHGHPGGSPARRGPRPAACCDGGYIVERIVHRQCEALCYEGPLHLEGLSCGLCPPFTLLSVEVVQIRPCAPAPARCDCGERLLMTLLCTVADAHGCRGECCADIELESRAKPYGCALQGLSLRRGAEVCVTFSRFCPACDLNVCLNIQLQTVFSRSEFAPSHPACERPCPPPLPLYPPPIRRFG